MTVTAVCFSNEHHYVTSRHKPELEICIYCQHTRQREENLITFPDTEIDELSRLKQENDRLFEQHLADCREINLLRIALSCVEWLPLPENYGTDIINADGDADPTLYKASANRETYLICPWCGAPEPFEHNPDCVRQEALYEPVRLVELLTCNPRRDQATCPDCGQLAGSRWVAGIHGQVDFVEIDCTNCGYYSYEPAL